MLQVDDEIAASERLQLGQEGVGILAAFLAADQPVAEQILLGNDLEVVAGEAVVERQHHGGELALGRFAERILPAFGKHGGRAGLAQDGRDAAPRPFRISGQQRPLARFRHRLEMLCGGFVDILASRTLRGEIARCGIIEVEHTLALRLAERIGAMYGARGQCAAEFVARQVERILGQRPVAALGLPGILGAAAAVVRDVGQPFVGGADGGVLDYRDVITAEMVEQRCQLFLEQRQPVFHPREATTFAHCLIERILRGVGAEHLTVSAAETLDAFLVDQCLAGGQEQMRIERPDGALRGRIEQAQAFQLVAEEIEPQPTFEAGRYDIEDRATHGKFARVDGGVAARIALPTQQAGEAVVADLRARLQFAHAIPDAERGEHALERGVDGGDEQLRTALASLQAVERRQPPRADRQGRAGAVERQTVPRGKLQHFQLWREEARGIGQRPHGTFVCGDEDGATLRCAGEVGHHQRLRPAHQRGERQRLFGGQDAGKVGHGRLAVKAGQGGVVPAGSGRGEGQIVT